jgi:hypothetical protein
VLDTGGTQYRWNFGAAVVIDPSKLLLSEWIVDGQAPTAFVAATSSSVRFTYATVVASGATAVVPNYPQGVGAVDTGPVTGGTFITT